jgi:hypothetical protein
MSNIVLAAVVVPIVVVVVRACWLFLVYRADRHPGQGGQSDDHIRVGPRRRVVGGRFRSTGGRQLMPRRDAPAETTAGPRTTAREPDAPGQAADHRRKA